MAKKLTGTPKPSRPTPKPSRPTPKPSPKGPIRERGGEGDFGKGGGRPPTRTKK